MFLLLNSTTMIPCGRFSYKGLAIGIAQAINENSPFLSWINKHPDFMAISAVLEIKAICRHKHYKRRDYFPSHIPKFKVAFSSEVLVSSDYRP